MTPGRWDERIARAQKLSSTGSSAAEMLRFYERMASAQKQVYSRLAAECGERRVARPAGKLREELDLTLLLPELRGFLGMLERHSPEPLAAGVREFAKREAAAWVELLSTWWAEPERTGEARDPCAEFCARAFLQPYAEYLAEHTELPVLEVTPSVCPLCGGKPQLGVLRAEGDGTRRTLVCSLCATEWNYGRIGCPACGEGSETNLAVYIAEEPKHVRIEACEKCRVYMKTVDLSKDGHAIPLVDEIATVPLDLWALEMSYTKLRANLLGM